MPSSTQFPARGKIVRAEAGAVIFAPSNTNYELKLIGPGAAGGVVEGVIRAQARKLWTVPSGGNFITPIQGPPRIVQGRVKYLDQQVMVVQAGVPVLVQLPPNDNQYDLNSGPLAVGALVNATLLPGASFEPLPPSAAGFAESVAVGTAGGPNATGAPQ